MSRDHKSLEEEPSVIEQISYECETDRAVL